MMVAALVCAVIVWPIIRAIKSDDAPGELGTTILICLAGKVCADASPQNASASTEVLKATRMPALMKFIILSPVFYLMNSDLLSRAAFGV
jgi:hypothetical protein